MPIIRAIEDEQFPDINDIRQYNKEPRFYFGKISSLILQQGLLVEKINQVTKTTVLISLQKSLVVFFHSDDHAGVDCTVSRISLYYLC